MIRSSRATPSGELQRAGRSSPRGSARPRATAILFATITNIVAYLPC
jgi:hypothetical protein